MTIDIDTIRMLNSYVLFKRVPVDQELKLDGVTIFLPTSQKYDNVVCEVVSVGPGEYLPDGTREDMMGLAPGDFIVIDQQNSRVIDKEYHYCDITEIWAKLDGYEKSTAKSTENLLIRSEMSNYLNA